MTAKNLGEILLEQGIIDKSVLDQALRLQGRKLGEILVQERMADPVAVAAALKLQARGRERPKTAHRTVDLAALEDVLLGADRLEDSLLRSQVAVLAPDVAPALKAIRASVEALLLQPVEALAGPARVVAEQLAAETGKRVEVSVEAVDLAVDRLVADEVADMLLHLVRNAIEHGVESPDARTAAGKAAAGQLKLRFTLVHRQLMVSVEDDGAGVNEAAVYAKAVSVGLLTKPRAELSFDDLAKVLFSPGFSTRASATAHSGRGVGLDVVETGALRLGATVHVASKPGLGTTFTVSLPLRLGRLSVVPLRAGREWLAVSSAEIAKIDRAGRPGAQTGQQERPASILFSGAAAPTSTPAFRVEFANGQVWLFDEVDTPQPAFIRELANGPQPATGLLGGARLADGRMMLWMDPLDWRVGSS